MCAPSPPAPPDYGAAAQAQGQANVEAARATLRGSNPNILTPTGSQIVTWGSPTFDEAGYNAAMSKYNAGGNVQAAPNRNAPQFNNRFDSEQGLSNQFDQTAFDAAMAQWQQGGGSSGPAPTKEQYTTYNNSDQATVKQTLSPNQQAIFDTNERGQKGLADLGLTAVNKAGSILGQNVDFSPLPAMPGSAGDTRSKVRDALLSRVNTDIERDRDATSANLIARGIPPGSEAYNREMERLDRQMTDSRLQADVQAGAEASRDFGMDTQRRQQAITELLTQRQTPLNEISALRSGSQVSMPQFQNYTGTTVQPAPIMQGAAAQGQAGQNAYNAGQAQSNATTSGLFSLGGAAMMSPAGTFKFLTG